MANFKPNICQYWWTFNVVVLMMTLPRLGVASPFRSLLTQGSVHMEANRETVSVPRSVYDFIINVAPTLVEALWALRTNLSDPCQILESWDADLINPCTFNHITCNLDNSVIRLDLGGGGLSGQLVPELAYLTNLQNLEVYNNNFSGSIPEEVGALQHLVSLDIYLNQFSGTIPASLGNLSSLRIFRAQNNSLSGAIPISLTNLEALDQLSLMNNDLTGEVPDNGSFSSLTAASFEDNPGLCGTIIDVPCPVDGPFSAPHHAGPSKTDSSSRARLGTLKWEAWLWITLVVTLNFIFATMSTN